MTKINYKIKTGTNKLNEMQNTKKIFRHGEQNFIQQLFKCVFAVNLEGICKIKIKPYFNVIKNQQNLLYFNHEST
jgi:hypothetical protein